MIDYRKHNGFDKARRIQKYFETQNNNQQYIIVNSSKSKSSQLSFDQQQNLENNNSKTLDFNSFNFLTYTLSNQFSKKKLKSSCKIIKILNNNIIRQQYINRNMFNRLKFVEKKKTNLEWKKRNNQIILFTHQRQLHYNLKFLTHAIKKIIYRFKINSFYFFKLNVFIPDILNYKILLFVNIIKKVIQKKFKKEFILYVKLKNIKNLQYLKLVFIIVPIIKNSINKLYFSSFLAILKTKKFRHQKELISMIKCIQYFQTKVTYWHVLEKIKQINKQIQTQYSFNQIIYLKLKKTNSIRLFKFFFRIFKKMIHKRIEYGFKKLIFSNDSKISIDQMCIFKSFLQIIKNKCYMQLIYSFSNLKNFDCCDQISQVNFQFTKKIFNILILLQDYYIRKMVNYKKQFFYQIRNQNKEKHKLDQLKFRLQLMEHNMQKSRRIQYSIQESPNYSFNTNTYFQKPNKVNLDYNYYTNNHMMNNVIIQCNDVIDFYKINCNICKKTNNFSSKKINQNEIKIVENEIVNTEKFDFFDLNNISEINPKKQQIQSQLSKHQFFQPSFNQQLYPFEIEYLKLKAKTMQILELIK